MGLSLAGGKTDKACLVVLDYFPNQGRLFLKQTYEKVKSEGELSGDLKLYEILRLYQTQAQSLTLDVPWSMPLCLQCKLACPGYEQCREPHVKWMWGHHREKRQKKRPQKLFTPYTQRCVEFYFQTELEDPFYLPHAMGANSAPLLARASFLARRLPQLNLLEGAPRVALWRLGNSLKFLKSHLRNYKHSTVGQQTRRSLLLAFSKVDWMFTYEQDRKILIENSHAFDALLLAYTGFLNYKGLTEPRPSGFPESEDWIQIPMKNLPWAEMGQVEVHSNG